MSDVELVAMSHPSATTGTANANQFIAYVARVSNPGNQNNVMSAPKLIRYLIQHEHWSPFEMVHITLGITTTRDISRQIIRHRSFAFQEFSQRYAVAENYVPRTARIQDEKNRQNSIELDPEMDGHSILDARWRRAQYEVIEKSQEVYKWALDNGIAKEQARCVLPEGNTETTLYMAGSLRSWIHYCQLRTGNGTQKEHQLIAKQAWRIISGHFPDVAEAVEWDVDDWN